MTADHVLDRLRSAGVSIRLTPERNLAMKPASALNDELRALVRANKPSLIKLLQRLPEPANDATQAPAQAKTRQPSADWRALDKAYQAHHVRCVQCIAAGRGAVYGLRCGVGAALWRAYDNSLLQEKRLL